MRADKTYILKKAIWNIKAILFQLVFKIVIIKHSQA